MKQHVQNVIHQQMNATGPVHIKSAGQRISKSIPVVENKGLDGYRDRFVSSDLMVGMQENRMIMQGITKTVIDVGHEQFDHGGERYAPQSDLVAGNQILNKKAIDGNATSQRMKIIQESPVIDKNGGLYESECKPTINGISSNSPSSDINGNSGEGITERGDKAFAIETNSDGGIANGHEISQSSPDANLGFSVGDNVR